MCQHMSEGLQVFVQVTWPLVWRVPFSWNDSDAASGLLTPVAVVAVTVTPAPDAAVTTPI